MRLGLAALMIVIATFAQIPSAGNARTPMVLAAAPRPMQPAYLSEMPSVERVKAEIRGKDRLDTAARQMGAFWQLRRIIELLAGPRIYRGATPDENRLIGAYNNGYASVAQPIERTLPRSDRPAWFDLHTKYELDAAFREELLNRFFSQRFRDTFRQAVAQEIARQRARAAQQRTQSRPVIPARRSSTPPGVFILLGLVALVVVVIVRRRRGARRLVGDATFAGAALLFGEQSLQAKEYAKAIESFKESIAVRPSSRAYRNLGDAHLALERYDDAAGAFEQAIRLDPDNVNAHYGLGYAHNESKNYEKAISALKEAVRIKPDFAAAWFILGVNQYLAGHTSDAETSLQQAIRSTSKEELFPQLYIVLGDIYLTAGKAAEALQLCPTLARLDAAAAAKLEAQARLLQANLYHKAREYAQAIESCKKVIALRPDAESLTRAYKLLGLNLHGAGHYADAVVALKEALRLKPNDQEIHFGLGWTYVEAEQYAEALPELEEAARLQPDDSETHYWIGEAHKGLGELDKALAAYREALRLNPEARTHNQIGLVLTELEQYVDAETEFNEAVRLKPDSALYHSNLGLLYVEIGDRAKALRVHQTLVKLDAAKAQTLKGEIDEYLAEEDDPAVLIGAGVALLSKGQEGAALIRFRRALLLAPSDAHMKSMAHTGIGQVYLGQEQYQKAADSLREALRLEQDNPPALAGLGRAYNGLEEYGSTISFFRQAVRILGKDLGPYADLQLAIAHFHIGQHPIAVEALERAIRAKPDFARAHFNLAITFLAMDRIEDAERVRGDLAKIDHEMADELAKAILEHKAGG
jgi:tetratricopeptide (TPR) repeat protein